MKKVLIVLLTILCCASLAFAADAKAPASGDLFAPGNITAQVGVGSYFFLGYIDVAGGAELGLGSFKVAPTIPLTYGVAARISYWGWTDNWSGTNYSYSDVGIGALGTLHLSWKNVFPDVKWLEKLESYVGLGLGSYVVTDNYVTSNNGFKFGFAGLEGNNWYITPNIAINLEEGYYGYGSTARLGVLFKF